MQSSSPSRQPTALPSSDSSAPSRPSAGPPRDAGGAAEAPAPDGAHLDVAPANITAVRTAAGLQRAMLSGAQDVEIRSHLDLRSLPAVHNSAILGVETEDHPKRFALLYTSPPFRSMRGNCSEADAEAALGLPPGTFPDLLPLKPRQCLLVMEQTWLTVNSGRVWVDNLYLKLSRRNVQPFFAFFDVSLFVNAAERQTYLYVTDTTFHGEHRGTARAIACARLAQVYADGCIFTDWAGFRSPLTLQNQCAATIRNSVFRNMHLAAELVDVSYLGIVNFQRVLLVNITLEHGSVVSTTINDYQEAIGYHLTYYAEDDANYDMPVTTVPVGSQGIFGEDWSIANSSISDCMFLLTWGNPVQPGCPNSTVAARDRAIARGGRGILPPVARGDDYAGALRAAGPLATEPFADYVYIFGPYAYTAPAPGPFGLRVDYDYEYAVYDPQVRLRDLMREEDVWFDEIRQVLPAHAPAPDWPPFQPPLPPPSGRTSLKPEPVTPSPATAAAMLGLLAEQTPPEGGGGGGRDINVMAILVVVAAEVLLAGALLWLCIVKGSQVARWCACGRRRQKAAQQGEHHHSVARLKSMYRGQGADCRQRASKSSARRPSRGNAPTPPHGHALDRSPVTGGRGNSGATRSDASADVPPASALNPDYEYALPHHLALYAQPPTSLMQSSSYEAGSTVVFAPYTVSPTQAFDSTGHVPTGGDTGDGIDAGRGAASEVDEASGVGDHRHASEHQIHGRHLRSFANDGKVSTNGDLHPASHACQQRAGTHPAEVAIRQATDLECRSGRRCPALAPAAGVTQHTTDMSTGAHAARRLQRQLDSFTASDLFLGRFEMLGRHHRRRGGQAVVQFAHSRQDHCEFAIKFFLDWDTFLTEASLYAAAFPHVRSNVSSEVAALAESPVANGSGTAASAPMSHVVARFLPQVEVVCDGAAGGLEDPRGRPLPPCIVMEKGESLQDLCDRAEPDIFTVFSVLSNVSRRLADMHAAGYVHRDIKPANVMWLPRQNRWTTIDFGCIARVGDQAPLSFSLAYAAPEVATAYRGRQRSIEAQPALDAWSLGVTALELLTGAPAFDLVAHGRSAVVSMLEGATPLPWEGELSRGLHRKLGVLGRPVLELLQREPVRRSTLEAFHASCAQIFANSTSASQP